MPVLTDLLQQGWLFLPSAVLLGALHGLEPGHSKTMMAAFIVAVQGTIGQAILLGLAATVSHTVVVWVIALGGLYFAHNLAPETVEPYLQLGSAVLIVGIALWMFATIHRRNRRIAAAATMIVEHRHDSQHDHDHGHGHAGSPFDHDDAHDSHAQAHADDIRRRIVGGTVTNGQILAFGLTGGLIPCAGAITILLLCLQMSRLALGATLVLGFSIGLAMTLVLAGVVASLGARQVARRWSGLSGMARRAPYASGAITLLIGLYVAAQAGLALAGRA